MENEVIKCICFANNSKIVNNLIEFKNNKFTITSQEQKYIQLDVSLKKCDSINILFKNKNTISSLHLFKKKIQ